MQCDRGAGKRPEAKKSVKGQVKGKKAQARPQWIPSM